MNLAQANIGQAAMQQMTNAQNVLTQRPVTRLEATKAQLQTCVNFQEGLNVRLVALANGLCGGHPSGKEDGPTPRAIPSGLADELDDLARTLEALQRETQELLTRLSEAIPEVR